MAKQDEKTKNSGENQRITRKAKREKPTKKKQVRNETKPNDRQTSKQLKKEKS